MIFNGDFITVDRLTRPPKTVIHCESCIILYIVKNSTDKNQNMCKRLYGQVEINNHLKVAHIFPIIVILPIYPNSVISKIYLVYLFNNMCTL